MRRVGYVLLVLTILAAGVAPAAAQIYSWRDGQGQLIVSDRPREDAGEMTTYAVPRASGVRATTATSTNSRSAGIDDAIEEHAAAHGVSPDLVRAVIQVESESIRIYSSREAEGPTLRRLGNQSVISKSDSEAGANFGGRLSGR